MDETRRSSAGLDVLSSVPWGSYLRVFAGRAYC